jgi:hypothetical protein
MRLFKGTQSLLEEGERSAPYYEKLASDGRLRLAIVVAEKEEQNMVRPSPVSLLPRRKRGRGNIGRAAQRQTLAGGPFMLCL